MGKFKIGDKVKFIKDVDSDGVVKIGSIGKIIAIDKKYLGDDTMTPIEAIFPASCFYRYEDIGDRWYYEKELEVLNGTVKTPKVNFLLVYLLDEDPCEEFETMTEVNERIAYLNENEDSLQKDSIVVYEVAKKYKVSVETKITKKLVK